MLAVIGGTGFGEFAGLVSLESVDIETPWGVASVEKGLLEGVPVLFIPRHGKPARLPPHRINYRANIDALAQLDASRIVAVNAVGGIDPSLGLPELAIPDQIIDYTWGRPQTFFDDEVSHIDFTFPYDAMLRGELIEAAEAVNVDSEILFRTSGVYGCTQGPRLETAAEIERMARDGCDLVGMTGMPEAALAREKGLAYAGISVVVNKAAGLDDEVIDIGGIEAVLNEGIGWVRDLLRQLVRTQL